MPDNKREKEEYLEKLWEMKEQDDASFDNLKNIINGDFKSNLLDELAREGFVELTNERREINLTEEGERQARRIIRAHRLGERLLYDVFGGEFETDACEFEHLSALGIVDGICTLLGHPRQCPHGMPIPEGECCRQSAKTTRNLIVPITELEIGQSARIAYVNCRDDGQMHKLSSLQIRPGSTIKLHQRSPCSVIECEGASIALDDEILSSICVWSNTSQFKPETEEPVPVQDIPRGWWGKRRGARHKKRRRQFP